MVQVEDDGRLYVENTCSRAMWRIVVDGIFICMCMCTCLYPFIETGEVYSAEECFSVDTSDDTDPDLDTRQPGRLLSTRHGPYQSISQCSLLNHVFHYTPSADNASRTYHDFSPL